MTYKRISKEVAMMFLIAIACIMVIASGFRNNRFEIIPDGISVILQLSGETGIRVNFVAPGQEVETAFPDQEASISWNDALTRQSGLSAMYAIWDLQSR